MDCINEVASVVYAEARGEKSEGQRAVVHVIMNRSKKYGLKPCIVVKQPNQFTKGIYRPRDPVWKRIKEIVLNPGYDVTKGALYFHTLSVKPYWSYRFTVTYTFGNHIFYRP